MRDSEPKRWGKSENKGTENNAATVKCPGPPFQTTLASESLRTGYLVCLQHGAQNLTKEPAKNEGQKNIPEPVSVIQMQDGPSQTDLAK